MLDFEPSSYDSEKQTLRTQIRHSAAFGALVERAHIELGVDKSAFIRAAIEKEANRVLRESFHHTLTPEQAAQFDKAENAATNPTPRMQEALESYGRRMAQAD